MANGDLLGIGTSGLLAFQRTLNTISHNVSNVNTEGYSRQTVELVTRPPQATGFGFIGNGVNTNTITRSYDAFVEQNLRSSTSSFSEYDAFHTLAAKLDNVLADSSAGLNVSLQRFFDAVQDLADDPASNTARQVLFDEADQLTSHFNELASWVDSIRDQVNNDIRSSVTEINQFSKSIAELNSAIVLETGRSGGHAPNDLLDQRDVLIKKLSELVSVSTVRQDDGAINVMIGSGQVIVRGNNASTLEVFIEAGDPRSLGVALKDRTGILLPVTTQLSGGRLGGVLGFRDRLLDSATNNLGLVAVGLGDFFNEQHDNGMDLDGALGIDFFNVPPPETLTISGTPANVAVAFNDVSKLTDANYRLQFNSGAWALIRTDTGQSIAMTGTGTAVDPFVADGIEMEVLSAPANGDTYLIRPTGNAALNLQFNLTNTRQIAAAAPMRVDTALGNTGSGVISAGLVTDIDNAVFQTSAGQLSPPVLVRFTSALSYDLYDNTVPSAPVLLEAGIAYNPATGGEVFPTPGAIDHGYRMRISGAPVVGDEFSTQYNTGGTGDNRNALLLAGISSEKLLSGGTASLTDIYQTMVAEVGSSTSQAERNSAAHKQLLDQAIATRESLSGVNLDEEAANLIRFQQAYQAAAQVIAAASSLFDTLLSVVRR